MSQVTEAQESPVRYGRRMEFRALGPIEVLDSDQRLEIGGKKQRAVLALLMANSGQPVSTDRLIEAAHGADAPDGARRSVQTYVSNLRSQIGDMITSVASGYEFRPIDSFLDTERFVGLLEGGRAQLEQDPEAAGEDLREALALWRGHPYSDIEASGELDAEITRLNELRMVALESRIDADLATGRDGELVGELEVLTVENPLREAFHSQHMLALYRAGRQAEALRAYSRMREHLADELGVDPSPALRQLEQDILEQSPDLLLAPKSAVHRCAVLVIDLTDSAVDSLRGPDERNRVLVEVDRAVERSIADADGALAAQQGTATYGTFGDVRAALDAAVDITRATPHTNGDAAVRLGLDLGDVEKDPGGGIAGPAVIRAAGLVTAAHPGQVLLSASAQAAVAADSAGGVILKALGQHPIARLEQPETVHQLVIDGLPSDFPDLLTDREPPELPIAHVRAPGYELRDEIGRGLFGSVYRAYQPSVGREVAVKVINPELANSAGFIRRFAVEAQMISRIEHPNVVPLHDFWRGPDTALLVMRLMRGGNLAAWASGREVDRDAALRLVDQVGGALATAHALGVAHGDVQSTNVLLNESADFFLSDFGVATDSPAPGGVMAQQVDVAAFAVMLNGAVPPGVFTETEAALVAAAQGGEYATAADWIEVWRREVGAAADSPTYTAARNPYKGLAAFNELDAVDFHGRAAVTSELVEAVGSHRLVAAVGPSGVGKSSVVRAGLLPALRRGAVQGSDQWLIADCVPGSHPFERLASSLIRVAASAPSDLEELLRSDERGLIKAVERYLPADTQLLIVIDQFEELFTLCRDQGTQDRFLDLLTTSVEDRSSPVRILVTMRADFFDRPLRHAAFGELLRAGTVPVSAPTDSEMRDIITRPAAGVGVDFEAGLVERMVTEVHGEAGALPLVEFALTELFDQRDTDLLTLDAYEVSGGVTAALGRRAESIYDGLEDADRDIVRQIFMRLVTPGEDGRDTRHRLRTSELVHLGFDSEAVDRIVARFGEHRLLTFDLDEVTRSSTVEVAHEALLREWPRLRDWIDANREELLMRSRLAVAVGDWEAADRSDAYVLSGGRLAQHETWSENTDLSLSATEMELLAESRRVEDERDAQRKKRRQFVMSGFVAAAIIGIVLAGFALAAGQRADDNAAEAETNAALAEANAADAETNAAAAETSAAAAEANAALAEANEGLAEANAAAAATSASLAEARELAASAINVLGEDPELSVLLSLQAINQTPVGADQPVEAANALWSAVQDNRLMQTLQTGYGDSVWVTLSPDDSTLFVANGYGSDVTPADDRVVQAYSTTDFETLWEVPFPLDGEFGKLGWMHVSPDGALLSVPLWDENRSVQILDANDGTVIDTISSGPDCGTPGPRGWSPDGSRFAMVSTCNGQNGLEGRVEVFDGDTFELVATPHVGFPDDVSFDEAGRLFVTTAFPDSEESLTIYDGPDYSTSTSPPGIQGWSDVSSDGSIIVTFSVPPGVCDAGSSNVAAADCGTLAIIETSTGDRIDLLSPLPAVPSVDAMNFGFSAGDRLFAVPTEGGETLVWEVATGEQVFDLPSGTSFNTAVSSDGRRMYTGGLNGDVKVWDLNPTIGLPSLGDLGRYSSVRINTNREAQTIGAFVAVDPENLDPQVFFYDLVTGALVGEPVAGQPASASYGVSPLAGDRFVIADPFPGAGAPYSWFIYDPMTSERTRIAGCDLDLDTGLCPGGEAPQFFLWATSADGTELVRNNFGGPYFLVDPSDGTPIEELLVSEDFFLVSGVTDEWIGGACNCGVLVVDRATGEELARIGGFTEQGFEIAADMSGMAFDSKSDSIIMIDFNTWESFEFPADLTRSQGLAIEPDLRRIAIGDQDGIQVYDFDTGDLLRRIPVRNVADIQWLSEDRLAVSTVTGVWASVSLLPDELVETATATLTRSFTADECTTYRIDSCPTLDEMRARS